MLRLGFCAALPNFKVMEIDIDDVSWKDDIVTVPPVIENGDFLLPTGPGWGDRFGPGTRVPTLIVSPFAKHGHVDKTSYDTTSIIKLITRRFELEPLAGARANAGDLTAAFDFTRQP